MNSFFYSIELTYYSISFLCKAMVNRSGFKVRSFNKQWWWACIWTWGLRFNNNFVVKDMTFLCRWWDSLGYREHFNIWFLGSMYQEWFIKQNFVMFVVQLQKCSGEGVKLIFTEGSLFLGLYEISTVICIS